MKELAKQYDPSQVEDRIYQFWLDGGYFHTKADPDKKPYTIVMPPPNVTGQLHMGHAVDNTMQDILIRTKRMQGYAALWVPGTDHASIATEAKVVEAMRAEGLTKEMVGRDGFLERAWAWKTKYGNRIVSQLKKLGSSCDWERERFTMDEGCSEAVKEVFVRLYDKGLIYRGNRMVNWCPHCNTSISDAEVEYEEKDGNFWHLLYPVKETGEMLELATTRPETMLGDTAVAINGEDPRYAHLHGCHVVLPLLNKEIPIVCDEHADMTKGTGVVKITPAHDPNDFEVGLRHDLPIVRVFTYDGHMTGAADKAAADALFAAGKNTVNEPHVLDCGKYAGMTTLEARKAILADLKEGGFLKEIEPLKHEVGTCYRCHSTIEPMVSKQWFVKMEPLAEPAIESVEKGDIKFVPERFTKNYMNWMKNTRDWCISRQLWWGHQIPAWYCDDCGETVVAKSAPCACPKCGKDLVMKTSAKTRGSFIGCMGWPDCDVTYPVPSGVKVSPLEGEAAVCPECGAPRIKCQPFRQKAFEICVNPTCPTNYEPDLKVGECKVCAEAGRHGDLIAHKSEKSGKRFIRCTNYDDCGVSYPLPARGKLEATGETCPECGAPIVVVNTARGPWRICVNMDCPTKEKKPARGRKTATKASTAKKTTAAKKTSTAKKSTAKKTAAKKTTTKKAAADK